jgi:hypothetical protein
MRLLGESRRMVTRALAGVLTNLRAMWRRWVRGGGTGRRAEAAAGAATGETEHQHDTEREPATCVVPRGERAHPGSHPPNISSRRLGRGRAHAGGDARVVEHEPVGVEDDVGHEILTLADGLEAHDARAV